MFDAGGVLYSRGPSSRSLTDPAKRHLQYALLAGIGGLIVMGKDQGNPDVEEARLFHMKYQHPALHATASRRRLATDSDDKYYAILKTAEDRSERVVAVYNFQSTPQTVKVDLGVVDTAGLVDLQTFRGEDAAECLHPVPVDLPAYGYRLFSVLPSAEYVPAPRRSVRPNDTFCHFSPRGDRSVRSSHPIRPENPPCGAPPSPVRSAVSRLAAHAGLLLDSKKSGFMQALC